MGEKSRVLITGAAGLVGGILRSHWGDRHRLRLADIRPIEMLAGHEEFAETDIAEYDQVLKACTGMDVVVHLAADPSMQAQFYQTLLPLNVIGAYTAFAAAREAGCKRIVFASSINAVLGFSAECGRGDQVLGRGTGSRLCGPAQPVVHLCPPRQPAFRPAGRLGSGEDKRQPQPARLRPTVWLLRGSGGCGLRHRARRFEAPTLVDGSGSLEEGVGIRATRRDRVSQGSGGLIESRGWSQISCPCVIRSAESGAAHQSAVVRPGDGAGPPQRHPLLNRR